MPESHERKVKRILGRDWDDLATRWLQYTPSITHPGEPPSVRLHDLPDLDSKLSSTPSGQVQEVIDDIPGLRTGLMHEAIYVAHKASHVLGSALVHVETGMCTWSLSSAYHSAYFAMKSILSLLGITVVESPAHGHFLVDVWGVSHERKKRKYYPLIVLCSMGRVEQRNMWAFFQRALSQTTGLDFCCTSELMTLLIQSDYKDFARQRNDIHYKSHVWGGNDLHQCSKNPAFGAKKSGPIDTTGSDFSLRLAFGLVKMCREMLDQVARQSVIVEREAKLIENWIAEPFNDLYRKCVS